MNNFYTKQINSVIERSKLSNAPTQEIFDIIFSLGRDVENDVEFQYAYNLLLTLCNHHHPDVRAYSIVGLSLLWDKGPIDRSTITEIIHREWPTAVGLQKSWIADATDDLNFLLGWDIHLE